ncbi:MAG TPA: hypothetical protein VM901_03480 [Bdellovibrionota bacterium]|nr:hypothetical protein [Bdellovibrionota bacterium]
MGRGKRFYILFLLALIFSPLARARSLEHVVTYAEFESLVREKVSQVPELASLWRELSQHSTKPTQVYFGGGALRGLLHRLHADLTKGGLAYARAQPVPPIEELLIQRDSDRDLMAPDEIAAQLKDFSDFHNWDILKRSFYAQSVQDRGLSFDRVYANPWRVLDDLRGLREFYQGQLVFLPKAATDFRLAGNSSTALALRFLRVAKDFEGEVEVSESSWQHLKAAVAGEALPRNVSATVKDQDSFRYWVKKALRKYFIAYEDDLARAMLTLRDTGLLANLAKGHYPFAADLGVEIYTFAEELERRGFSENQLRQFARMACWDVGDCLKLHEFFLHRFGGFDDVVDFFRGFRHEASEEYRDGLAELFAQHRQVFERHLRSLDDLLLLRPYLNSPAMYREYLVMGFAKVKNFDDLMAFLDTFKVPLTLAEFSREQFEFVQTRTWEIFEHTKTVAQVQKLLEHFRDPPVMAFMLGEGLRRTTRPLGFLMLLDHDRDVYRYSADLQSASDRVLLENFETFARLNPTEGDWAEYRARFFSSALVNVADQRHRQKSCVGLLDQATHPALRDL